MGNLKSAPFYERFYICLLQDAARMCNCSERELDQDLNRFRLRFASEGIRFLTETLPSFGKALDRALSTHGTSLILQTRKRACDDSRPAFLWAYWKEVFNSDNSLKEEPSVLHIRVLRQLLYVLYKLALPYDEAKTQKVLDSFESVEEELRVKPDSDFDGPIIDKARSLIGRVLCNFDYRDIKPRHGPGAVSTGEKLHRKMTFSRLYHEVERIYPFTEYFMLASDCPDLSIRELDLTALPAGTAKVVLVQKDSRGPRLISCEPLEYQWIQQGLGRALQAYLEASHYTRGRVNFTHQQVNRDLAHASSLTREFATLDMKDASDRVSIALVERLFGNTAVLEALMATRSYWTRLPNGRVRTLFKFAPMGSALCFPVEALCFWALGVAVLVHEAGYSWRKARKSVYVYGDDLIVPLEVCERLIQYFPKVGLMFNPDKCCTTGFFRESCGWEAYKGFSVKPTRLRKVWVTTREPGTLAAYAAYSNALRREGWSSSADFIVTEVETLWGPLPYLTLDECEALKSYQNCLDRNQDVPPDRIPVVGWYDAVVAECTMNKSRLRSRYNRDLQRIEFWCWALGPVVKQCPIVPTGELLCALAHSSPRATVRVDGRTRVKPGQYALRRRVAAKRRWVAVGL
jgi:hypothetical protein